MNNDAKNESQQQGPIVKDHGISGRNEQTGGEGVGTRSTVGNGNWFPHKDKNFANENLETTQLKGIAQDAERMALDQLGGAQSSGEGQDGGKAKDAVKGKKRGRKPKVKRTEEQKANLRDKAIARWAAKKAPAGPVQKNSETLTLAADGTKAVPISQPAIDYDRLAEAMVRAQMKLNPHQIVHTSSAVALAETPMVVRGNNPVNRILAQLKYPKDKEANVIAMVCANMSPSWGETNGNDVNGVPNPPLGEAAVVAHLREWCETLRPELPVERLEPKYTLRDAAGVAIKAV
jgi:hypothetical protein